MRELPVGVFAVGYGAGITPARAGTTPSWRSYPNSTKDHPRTCGNYVRLPRFRSIVSGSPPHVRELQAIRLGVWHRSRITPARAGTTCSHLSTSGTEQDHPRTCGNYSPPVSTSSWISGSPPHVRELLVPPEGENRDSGITPARAGTTHRKTRQVNQ